MRVSQTPKTPLQVARQRLSQGRYYAGRTDEVLLKSRSALDGYVGPAMNIMHDNEERNVSRLGSELSSKVRRSARYLNRGEANQSAYNKALAEAADSLQLALEQATQETNKSTLSQALTDLDQLRADPGTEGQLKAVDGRLSEGRTRLGEVEQDAPGRDVSHQGRPIWNLFGAAQRELNAARDAVKSDQTLLDAVIEDLEPLPPQS